MQKILPRLEFNEAASPFDPRSGPLYLMLATAFGTVILAIKETDFTVGHGPLVGTFFVAIWITVSALAARRYGMARTALILEAVSVPLIIGALTVAATVMLCAISAPFADRTLDAADRSMGFDWLALYRFYQAHPLVLSASGVVYGSYVFQDIAVPILLAAMGRDVWGFLTAWAISLVVAVILFPMLPAAGPYVLHGLKPDDMPALARIYPWQTGPAIEAIRSGHMRSINEAARGFVSFPSCHASGAVMFMWATLRIRWIGWPMAILNVLLIASAAITGAHYFVDLIAGCLLGVASIIAAQRVLGPHS